MQHTPPGSRRIAASAKQASDRSTGAGLDLAHVGPPPVERSLACFADAAMRRDPGGVCCTVADAVGTLTAALAAQEAAQRGAGAGGEATSA